MKAARRRLAIAGMVLLLAAAGLGLILLDPFSGSGRANTGVTDNGYPTGLARVVRRSLASRTSVSGTLEYAGSYSMVNQAAGAATWLPHVGQVIGRGGVLYRVDGKPVVLLYGSVPAWRELKEGMTGKDVRQLNANLAALGYSTDASSALKSLHTSHVASRIALSGRVPMST